MKIGVYTRTQKDKQHWRWGEVTRVLKWHQVLPSEDPQGESRWGLMWLY